MPPVMLEEADSQLARLVPQASSGKLSVAKPVDVFFAEQIMLLSLQLLPITLAHVGRAATLPSRLGMSFVLSLSVTVKPTSAELCAPGNWPRVPNFVQRPLKKILVIAKDKVGHSYYAEPTSPRRRIPHPAVSGDPLR